MIQGEIKQDGITFKLKHIYQNKLEGFAEFILEDIDDLGKAGHLVATQSYGDTTALYIGS